MDAQVIKIFSDSYLVVSHVKGSFKAKDPQMVGYLKNSQYTIG